MTTLVLTLPRPLSVLVANGEHDGSEQGLPYHFTQPSQGLSLGQMLLLHTSAGPGSQDAHARAGALGYPPAPKGVFCGIAKITSAVQAPNGGCWHLELGDCAAISGVVPDKAHRKNHGDHVLWVPSEREIRAVLRMLSPEQAKRVAA